MFRICWKQLVRLSKSQVIWIETNFWRVGSFSGQRKRALEIVGEAARGVSDELKNGHPEIPWRSLVGQRNVLTHEYGNVDHDLLYETVVRDVPAIIQQLTDLLSAYQGD